MIIRAYNNRNQKPWQLVQSLKVFANRRKAVTKKNPEGYTSNEIIRLAHHNEETLSLSFTSPEVNHVRQRGDRYFEGVLIKKEGWYAAAKLALEEYFEVLLRVVKSNPGDSTSRTMMSYYDVWKNLKAIEV